MPQTVEPLGFMSLAASSSSDIWLVGQSADFAPLFLHYDGKDSRR